MPIASFALSTSIAWVHHSQWSRLREDKGASTYYKLKSLPSLVLLIDLIASARGSQGRKSDTRAKLGIAHIVQEC